MDVEERERLMKLRKLELDAVNAALPELEFNGYGNGCPWQGEGKYLPIEGAEFYVRFRHNQASMTVFSGAPFESDDLLSAVIYPWFDPETERSCENDAGTLHGEDEIIAVASALIEKLAPVSEDNPTSQMLLASQVQALMDACGMAERFLSPKEESGGS